MSLGVGFDVEKLCASPSLLSLLHVFSLRCKPSAFSPATVCCSLACFPMIVAHLEQKVQINTAFYKLPWASIFSQHPHNLTCESLPPCFRPVLQFLAAVHAGQVAYRFQGFYCIYFQSPCGSVGMTDMQAFICFYTGCGDSNTGPHTYTADSLPTEISFQYSIF